MSWIDLHKLADAISGINQKPLYIILLYIFLFFIILPIKREWVQKKKQTFLRLFDNSLLKYVIFKRILACNGCFPWLTKIKRRSGTSIWCKFSAWFLHKNVFYLILCHLTKFHCHTFFASLDMKLHVLSSSYLDNWWRQKLYDLYWIIF